MTQTALIDVQLSPRRKPRNKWGQEQAAFLEMLPELLRSHRGKYVAVHEGAVVTIGDHPVAVAIETYAKYGYVAIHVGLVTDQVQPRIRMPSPRQLKNVELA